MTQSMQWVGFWQSFFGWVIQHLSFSLFCLWVLCFFSAMGLHWSGANHDTLHFSIFVSMPTSEATEFLVFFVQSTPGLFSETGFTMAAYCSVWCADLNLDSKFAIFELYDATTSVSHFKTLSIISIDGISFSYDFYSKESFLEEATNIIHVGDGMGIHSILKRFKSAFGISVYLCTKTWNRMRHLDILSNEACPKHLLWTLLWLNTYISTEMMCATCECSKNTFKRWRDEMVNSLTRLDVVSHEWENNHQQQNKSDHDDRFSTHRSIGRIVFATT